MNVPTSPKNSLGGRFFNTSNIMDFCCMGCVLNAFERQKNKQSKSQGNRAKDGIGLEVGGSCAAWFAVL